MGLMLGVASPKGVGHCVPRGPQLSWQPGDQSQPAVTCPVTRSSPGMSLTCTAWHGPATLLEPASPWMASTESWERTRCQDDSKGCSFLVIPPNRSPHAGGASHQLRGHPGFIHEMNGGAPVAGSCHINLCSCVVLKALQSMFL